jgi:hypothetical protein
LAVFADLMDGYDVLMVQPGRRLGLALKPGPVPLVGREARRQELESDLSVQLAVFG